MKMEFESEQIARYMQLLKTYDLDRSALQVVYQVVLESGRFPDLALSLQAARIALQPEMDAKYDPTTETLLKAPTEAALNKALADALAKWTPKGPRN